MNCSCDQNMKAFTFISLAALIVQISGCPDGWLSVGSSCYRASVEKMTWYEAQEDCWAHGGYLAELTSREEETAVNEVVNHDEHFWIGLNDVAQEGEKVY